MHEWEYDVEDEPKKVIDSLGEISFDRKEPINNLVTWVYEDGSFVPCGKLIGNESYSIISDYIGRPIQAFDGLGNLVWSTDYDIYGNLRNLKGSRNFIPFRQLGQYEDVETGLYYNRFRYYDSFTGLYISQDPISILGGLNVYSYVFDSNTQVDVLGLDRISFKAAFRQAKRNLGIPKNINTPKPIKVQDKIYEDRIVWAFEREHKGKFIVMHEKDKYGRKKHLHTASSMDGMVDPTEPGRYNQHKGHIPEDMDGFKGCH